MFVRLWPDSELPPCPRSSRDQTVSGRVVLTTHFSQFDPLRLSAVQMFALRKFSFDHFVGAHEEGLGDRDSNRRRGFEVSPIRDLPLTNGLLLSAEPPS